MGTWYADEDPDLAQRNQEEARKREGEEFAQRTRRILARVLDVRTAFQLHDDAAAKRAREALDTAIATSHFPLPALPQAVTLDTIEEWARRVEAAALRERARHGW